MKSRKYTCAYCGGAWTHLVISTIIPCTIGRKVRHLKCNNIESLPTRKNEDLARARNLSK